MKKDPRNFLLNTDYEMDKIVYYTSGDITPGYWIVGEYDLGFIPLVFGVFSFTEDFSDTRMSWTSTDDLWINLEADSEGVNINYRNEQDQNKKLYYRVYGFMPSNCNANMANTQKYAKKFIMDTDYNYCKLYKKGIVDTTTTITHNLGYTPLVLAWHEFKWTNPAPGLVTPCWASGHEGSFANIESTPTTVKITGIPNNCKVHYRIYYDEV